MTRLRTQLRPCVMIVLSLACLLLAGGESVSGVPDRPSHRAELIFPLDYLHNHGSCVVECPNGDLLACWYRGSGERRADDVRVLGARKRAGSSRWSEPFVMADTPGFPDCNPSMVIDPQKRLWLFWPVIIANEWHTALLMSRVSERYGGRGAPIWARERPILLKPGEEFTRIVHESVARDLRGLDAFPADRRAAVREYLETRRKNAADKYFMRMGWMPRVHPFILDEKRMILPLYSDGFDFSLFAITDDGGETWRASKPLVGAGPVQPSIVQRRDGTLVAYMRDNGPPPQRLLVSESPDRGETWSEGRDSDIPNPGSGAEVIGLRNGHWALVNNDTERGRHSLAVWISDDEGKTWRWKRHLERDLSDPEPNTFGYPSLIQAAGGALHCTYTYSLGPREARKDADGRTLRECIKHARFNEAWVQAGDPN
jgi:predicted neuraminidase